jgi:hypothetical protein
MMDDDGLIDENGTTQLRQKIETVESERRNWRENTAD